MTLAGRKLNMDPMDRLMLGSAPALLAVSIYGEFYLPALALAVGAGALLWACWSTGTPLEDECHD